MAATAIMMTVKPTLIFHGCIAGISCLEFDRPFISCAAAAASAALVLAEGSGYPRRRPSVASMHGKPGGGFGGDTLGAVVLGRNLDVDAPAAALNVQIFKLRVRVLYTAILDGQT